MTVDAFQKQVLEDLASLKTQMYALVGNGQPGRLHGIEEDLEELKSWREQQRGKREITSPLWLGILSILTSAGTAFVIKVFHL